jgi:serine/threonine protein kinase
MLLFGRHPFLSESDSQLSQADQMVRLIENTVKGHHQLPAGVESTPAADLLRRILVPSPRQRYGIKDILLHPWFVDKLPPGALELNSAYLPRVCHYQDARQTPDTIKQIIRAAIQVAGPDGRIMPAPSTTSTDWPDSPSGNEENAEVQQQQQAQRGGWQQQQTVVGQTITSQMPTVSAPMSTSYSQQQHPHQHQPQQQQQVMTPSSGDMAWAQQQQQQLHQQQLQLQQQQVQGGWSGNMAGPGDVGEASCSAGGRDDPEFMDMLGLLGSNNTSTELHCMGPPSAGLLNSGAAAGAAAGLAPDPEVDALLRMDMDTSGNLFDSSLLKILQFEQQS